MGALVQRSLVSRCNFDTIPHQAAVIGEVWVDGRRHEGPNRHRIVRLGDSQVWCLSCGHRRGGRDIRLRDDGSTALLVPLGSPIHLCFQFAEGNRQ